MHKLITLSVIALITACDYDSQILAGVGPISTTCANLQTQQTQVLIATAECPPGWVHGSINECTQVTTGNVELKLMESMDECPEGYTGGQVHDECGVLVLSEDRSRLEPVECRQLH